MGDSQSTMLHAPDFSEWLLADRYQVTVQYRCMKITGIDCHVLLVPDLDTGATSSAQDDIVVFVHTDDGITGVGETDVNPWIAKACIEAPSTHTMGMGLKDMLLGENPLEPERIWEKLYTGSAMNGRRGALICAIGALDMALWDI